MKRWIRENQKGICDIFFYWGYSRILLVVAGWFTTYFPKNALFWKDTTRSVLHSSVWLLDIWYRWDAGYYMSIVTDGYWAASDFQHTMTNLAFFPLYPYLVKGIARLIPTGLFQKGMYLFIGLALSNLALILGLIGLYALGKRLFSERAAMRAVGLTLCLPGAFYFSAFYTESLFLCLIIFACLMAERESWFWAGLLGALAALTRSHGFLLLIPLCMIYLAKRSWNFRKMRADVLWFALIPLAVLLHFLRLYQLTGNFFAFFDAQAVWGRSIGGIQWQNYLRPLFGSGRWIAWIDLGMVLFCAYFCIDLCRLSKGRPYGVFGIVMLLTTVTSGYLHSSLRLAIVIFPAMLWAGVKIKDPRLYAMVCAVLGVLQLLLFSGWVNYFWIA